MAATTASTFARELEARGRARATVTRRLCTIAGFYKPLELKAAVCQAPQYSVVRARHLMA